MLTDVLNWPEVAANILALKGLALSVFSLEFAVATVGPTGGYASFAVLAVLSTGIIFIVQQAIGSVIAGHTWEAWRRFWTVRDRRQDIPIPITELNRLREGLDLAAETINALAAENRRLGMEVDCLRQSDRILAESATIQPTLDSSPEFDFRATCVIVEG